MSQLMPENENEMLKIDGVTKSNFEKFGEPLLEITQQAAAEKLCNKIYIHLILTQIEYFIKIIIVFNNSLFNFLCFI